MALFAPDKLNIATLGNLVPQLPMDHVARYVSDPPWPGSVWGIFASALSDQGITPVFTQLRACVP